MGYLSSDLITSSPNNPFGGFGIPELVPARVAKNRRPLNGNRINFVIPAIYEKWWFGGPATALRLFQKLATRFEYARIILPNQAESQFDFSNWPDWVVDRGDIAPQSIAFLDNGAGSLSVSATDFFMATFWSTATYIKDVIARQEQLFPGADRRFVYLIQDYEPGFYPYTARYECARATYRDRDKTIAVFNSQFLADYFRQNGLIFSEEHVFEPMFNSRLKQKKTELAGCPKERLIMAYGRPSVSRNDFDLAVEGLRIWATTFPSASQWTVITAGEKHADVPLGGQSVLKSLGKLSLDDYSRHLAKCWAGLSFMFSPHPSYPPLEMAEFGAWVITNRFENKNLATLAPNIISAESTPDAVAERLIWCCEQYQPGKTAAIANLNPVFRGIEGDEFWFSHALAESWLHSAIT